MPEEKQTNRLILFLLVFTVLIIMVGYFQFRNAIYAPFSRTSKEQTKEQTQEELSGLVLQDTDSDGLTDFDEQLMYLTSMYIADTDSDAYSDKEEVDVGSDPLDKKSTPYTIGKDPLVAEKKKWEFVLTEDSADKQEILETTFPAPKPETELSAEFLSKVVSIEEIRELLIGSGIDKDIVDNLDDKTLETLYNETIQETLGELTAPKENNQ